MINKKTFSVKNTKKVLHKVGKRWVVMSAVLLGLVAGGAALTSTHSVAMPSSLTVEAHADPTVETQPLQFYGRVPGHTGIYTSGPKTGQDMSYPDMVSSGALVQGLKSDSGYSLSTNDLSVVSPTNPSQKVALNPTQIYTSNNPSITESETVTHLAPKPDGKGLAETTETVPVTVPTSGTPGATVKDLSGNVVGILKAPSEVQDGSGHLYNTPTFGGSTIPGTDGNGFYGNFNGLNVVYQPETVSAQVIYNEVKSGVAPDQNPSHKYVSTVASKNASTDSALQLPKTLGATTYTFDIPNLPGYELGTQNVYKNNTTGKYIFDANTPIDISSGYTADATATNLYDHVSGNSVTVPADNATAVITVKPNIDGQPDTTDWYRFTDGQGHFSELQAIKGSTLPALKYGQSVPDATLVSMSKSNSHALDPTNKQLEYKVTINPSNNHLQIVSLGTEAGDYPLLNPNLQPVPDNSMFLDGQYTKDNPYNVVLAPAGYGTTSAVSGTTDFYVESNLDTDLTPTPMNSPYPKPSVSDMKTNSGDQPLTGNISGLKVDSQGNVTKTTDSVTTTYGTLTVAPEVEDHTNHHLYNNPVFSGTDNNGTFDVNSSSINHLNVTYQPETFTPTYSFVDSTTHQIIQTGSFATQQSIEKADNSGLEPASVNIPTLPGYTHPVLVTTNATTGDTSKQDLLGSTMNVLPGNYKIEVTPATYNVAINYVDTLIGSTVGHDTASLTYNPNGSTAYVTSPNDNYILAPGQTNVVTFNMNTSNPTATVTQTVHVIGKPYTGTVTFYKKGTNTQIGTAENYTINYNPLGTTETATAPNGFTFTSGKSTDTVHFSIDHPNQKLDVIDTPVSTNNSSSNQSNGTPVIVTVPASTTTNITTPSNNQSAVQPTQPTVTSEKPAKVQYVKISTNNTPKLSELKGVAKYPKFYVGKKVVKVSPKAAQAAKVLSAYYKGKKVVYTVKVGKLVAKVYGKTAKSPALTLKKGMTAKFGKKSVKLTKKNFKKMHVVSATKKGNVVKYTVKYGKKTGVVYTKVSAYKYVPYKVAASMYHQVMPKAFTKKATKKAKKAKKAFYVYATENLLVHNSKHFSSNDAVKVVKKGTTLKVLALVHDSYMTRYALGHGMYITGLKSYVSLLK